LQVLKSHPSTCAPEQQIFLIILTVKAETLVSRCKQVKQDLLFNALKNLPLKKIWTDLQEMLYFSITIIHKNGLCGFTKISALGMTSHHLRMTFLSGILCRVGEELDSSSFMFHAPVKKVSCTCSMCWATIPPDEGNLVLTFALVDGKRARTTPSRAWERC